MTRYDAPLAAPEEDAAPTVRVDASCLPDVIPGFRSKFGGLWTDLNVARELVEGRRALGRIDESEASLLTHWIEQGFVVIEGAVSRGLIDEVRDDLTATLAGDLSPRKVEHWRNGEKRISDASTDILHRPGSKLLDLHETSPSAQHMIFARPITRFLSLVFDRPPLAFQSLAMIYGTQQPVHQDTAFVRVSSALEFVGCWIAFEDVVPGSGELEYYPRSHTLAEELFEGTYKWVPDGTTVVPDYSDRLHERARRAGLTLERFRPRKGDALLWAADLIHGGAPIEDPGLTRQSFVTHYCPVDREPTYLKSRRARPPQASVNGGYVAAARWF